MRDCREQRVPPRRPAGRDVSHIRDRGSGHRRPRGRGACQVPDHEPQGGERADDVHGRRPERQEPDMRARERPRHRPEADRDVQPPHTHGRPRRGLPQAGVRRARRLPLPHVGCDRDGSAQDVGDPVRRGHGAQSAVLVRWGCRTCRVRREHEHRTDPANRSGQGRSGRGQGWGDSPVRLGPGGRGGGDGAQGERDARRDRLRRDRFERGGGGDGAGTEESRGWSRRGEEHHTRRPRGLLRPHAGQLSEADRRRRAYAT
mmetsp:Transcript_25159/g.57375  ORF Transcript_25159/g.57375 Transcript_25159/m.57375 type:complete len:259 (-) Transcript_25159:91-867(-)